VKSQSLIRFLNKPEYLLRPRQLVSRIRFAVQPINAEMTVKLPWGLDITVQAAETIGRSICTYGLYDLVTTESIVRLLDPGETAIDVGANNGYMTGLMAWRAGSIGEVICFEPSGQLFGELSLNLSRWQQDVSLARVRAHQLALSSVDGEGELHIPISFRENHGTASLESSPPGGPSIGVEKTKLGRLDSFVSPNAIIGVVKIDVEGHEIRVLEGAEGLLRARRVRDIIFEDHGSYPTASQRFLESLGYSVYRLSRTFSKPVLCKSDDPRGTEEHPIGVLPNYLATLDSDRVTDRFSAPGWRTYSVIQ
jgi:FkbM family methyltransferase